MNVLYFYKIINTAGFMYVGKQRFKEVSCSTRTPILEYE